jgi:hypothetical protein
MFHVQGHLQPSQVTQVRFQVSVHAIYDGQSIAGGEGIFFKNSKLPCKLFFHQMFQFVSI